MKTLLEISIQNIEKEMSDTQQRWTAYVPSKPLVDSTRSFNNRNNITQVKNMYIYHEKHSLKNITHVTQFDFFNCVFLLNGHGHGHRHRK